MTCTIARAQKRVRLVEHKKRAGVAGFGKRSRDIALAPADIAIKKIRGTPLEDWHLHALCEVARKGTLAGSGRTAEAKPTGIGGTAGDEPFCDQCKVMVGIGQFRLEPDAAGCCKRGVPPRARPAKSP